jgi:F0F1-type ATP synthase assembly protein I
MLRGAWAFSLPGPGEVSMPERPPNPKELGQYVTLAQIGMEMVVPAGIGLLLDYYVGCRPWGVIGGAVLGLIGGLVHLVAIVNQQPDMNSSEPRQDLK